MATEDAAIFGLIDKSPNGIDFSHKIFDIGFVTFIYFKSVISEIIIDKIAGFVNFKIIQGRFQ